ncbi:MAG: hypothetical protein CMP12_08445 [Zunongwangia sp.]|jgi:glucan phosphoethanolaminetransferase (alkaline phosphatase superfamily)|uniref:Transmembrane protein n=2 Tax=Zunongwangia profunda TaxID=398743 RepID=D5BGQ7_ZUNPS|nr:hypothetical protein [Zunongwangia profunda]MAO35927.1 hypothetical protein [Zunongwangia sp.]ADF53238.1 hypothetical protein ZPR_2918 [Zunongwangia profunda SM-A87]MAS69515.1 hypothetical protein [Zunongwangia sp.]MCC4229412.1 hypothetical protein [Zunongwangia profunda]HAJ82169.1 hypothetical protein [Zunongwangia profunda]|tara:strand:+ start:665 stop:928 length:264 start_codon:yes stop_codon:yes gene_type:complete
MEVYHQNEQPNLITPQKWALYIFVAGLPFIGIIMLLVWAFGSDPNYTRKNWAKGMLLLYVILFILSIIFFVFLGGMAFLTSFASQNY